MTRNLRFRIKIRARRRLRSAHRPSPRGGGQQKYDRVGPIRLCCDPSEQPSLVWGSWFGTLLGSGWLYHKGRRYQDSRGSLFIKPIRDHEGAVRGKKKVEAETLLFTILYDTKVGAELGWQFRCAVLRTREREGRNQNCIALKCGVCRATIRN